MNSKITLNGTGVSPIEIPDDVQGLVFDCDGTIADTMPLHYMAWVEALKEFDCEFPEALFYELAGMPTPQIIELLNERHGHSMPVHETADNKEELFQKLLPGVIPIEPVVLLVKQFAGKLPMAVATGATTALCRKTLSYLDLADYFDAIVGSDEVKKGKPAPDIFLESARRLNVPPERCYAFEDGDLGLQAARAAGMIAIDVRPYQKRPE